MRKPMDTGFSPERNNPTLAERHFDFAQNISTIVARLENRVKTLERKLADDIRLHQPIPDMSLRDWFAGQVLQFSPSSSAEFHPELIVQFAYAMADAMLVERVKKKD